MFWRAFTAWWMALNPLPPSFNRHSSFASRAFWGSLYVRGLISPSGSDSPDRSICFWSSSIGTRSLIWLLTCSSARCRLGHLLKGFKTNPSPNPSKPILDSWQERRAQKQRVLHQRLTRLSRRNTDMQNHNSCRYTRSYVSSTTRTWTPLITEGWWNTLDRVLERRTLISNLKTFCYMQSNLKCNLFLWSKLYFQHHYSSLQSHMILQKSF